ncbi:putative nuclear matrix protein [Leucosporidium creatinivorum]|uniref:Pre-mRNA-processing factor 19 n=1 Tax=Leucosporidium creatinivorum TaxID=106004 RepID=A0A1Y2ER39_9BASI|nr:putative nuclear matrix protein [Leucosporidium creatinivorum]
MSLFCAISGQPPLNPVLSIKSGTVYEKSLIQKYLQDNAGKDPITGDQLQDDDLVDIKTAPSTPAAPPRAPTFTSVPSLLHTLQSEWDATMLECLELRRAGDELRLELSHALYKEDAAMRVLARLTRERDEAREALASVKATLGPAFSTGAPAGDVEMEVEPVAAEAGLPAEAKARVAETNKSLSATRKKRKPAEGYATPASLKTYVQSATVPSLHGTKPPGIAALDLAKSGSLIVTGGLDKAVLLYDRSTSKILATLKGHTKKVTSVISSTTLTEAGLPTYVISSSLDKSVRVWAPNGNKTVYGAIANLSLGGEVNDLSLHPSGTLVASAAADGTWSIHDLPPADSDAKPTTLLTGSLPADTPEGTSNTAIAFHPDGAIFGVGSSDSKIRIFDTPTGACIASFAGHSEVGGGAITSLSFSENGYTLASSALGSNQVKLWDLRRLSNSANIELPEGQVVNEVRFDESAQFLGVVGTDARVYQNKTWEELVKSEENGAELTGVRFAEGGKEVIVAGVDRTVRVLSAPSE